MSWRRGIVERERPKEREGMIFAREGCAVRRTAAQNRPLRPAAARIFLPPSGPLSRPLFFFFFSPSRRRGARADFHPRGPRRFFFSSVCAATPPRHNGRVPENSSLRRRPFPRSPRVFFADSPRASAPLSRAPSSRSSPLFPPFPPFLVYPFFSPFFFVPATPPPPPAADVDVDPTSAVSVARARSPLFSASPPGVYFKRSLDPRRPRRDTVCTVLYTVLEARNVCARLRSGVYTAAV